jgi:hypothetical protein
MTQFQDIENGTEFFDPVSGEYWVKLNATQAQQLSGGDYEAGGCDAFDPEESVDPVDPVDENEPWDGFNSDAEADADALASAGMGTDEDYGGGDERY